MFAVEPTAFVPGRDLRVSGSGTRRGGWVRLPVALVVTVALAADAVLYCLLLEISTFTFRQIALHGAYRSLLWLDASLFVGIARLIWCVERRSIAQEPRERPIRAACSRLEGASLNRRNPANTVLHGDPVPRSGRYISSLVAVKQ